MLDNCGEVIIPEGEYLISGTLKVHSNTTVKLSNNTRMIWSDKSGKDSTSFLLTADLNAENITVDGGIWDGNRNGNPRNPDTGYLGVLIHFEEVKNLTLKNMTISNSESFHLRLNWVKGFMIENITFLDEMIGPNQDGVHIAGGCEDGTIKNIKAIGPFSVNDDLIALISDVNINRMSKNDPCLCQRNGPIRNINIYNISAENTFSFLRLCSEREPIENISVRHVSGGCYYIGVTMQISPYLRGREDGYSYYGVGNINNIILEDWNIYSLEPATDDEDWKTLAKSAVNGFIEIEESVKNLKFSSFKRDLSRDVRKDLPTILLNNRQKNLLQDIDEKVIYSDEQPYKIFANHLNGVITTIE